MRAPLLILSAIGVIAACARAANNSVARLPTTSPAVAQADSVQEFEGYWTRGFEASAFVPCDTLPRGSIWLEMPQRVFERKQLPAGERISPQAVRHYVRVRGVLHGPPNPPRIGGGGYGHFKLSANKIVVTELLELRHPRNGRCQPRSPDSLELTGLATHAQFRR